MDKKINYATLQKKAYSLMLEFEELVNSFGVDPLLLELIKIRVSQINGCAYCLNMHCKEAISLGEDSARLFTLSAWRDSLLFSDKERVVLDLVEHVTLISSKDKVPSFVYDRVREFYSDEEYVGFIYCINQINAWNRISISMGNRAS